MIAGMLREQNYTPGAAMITEGETGSSFFLLLEGRASVYKATVEGDLYRVAGLDASHHAFFGEGGLLDSDARSATIKADTPCRCLILESELFEKFCRERPEWALPILRRISRGVLARLRKSSNDLTLIYKALVSEIRGA